VSISSDGATVRRERILDMLRYIRSFMPRGLSLIQVQMYMSLAHGLTYKTSGSYVYEMQMSGIIVFTGGLLTVNVDKFKQLMELMAPDRDPDTGEIFSIMGLLPSTPDILDVDEEPGIDEESKDKSKNPPRVEHEDFTKREKAEG